MTTNNFIYDNGDYKKTPLTPYLIANGYNFYIFQQNTIIDIKFNNTVTGQLIVIGPGGDGDTGNGNTDDAGKGGIGSAYIYDPAFTFYGQNYVYNIFIPEGTLPGNQSEVIDNSKETFFRGINGNFTITSKSKKTFYSTTQTSEGKKNNVVVSQQNAGGGPDWRDNCIRGSPSSYKPIIINPLSFYIGGGGSGGNSSRNYYYRGNGGKAGRGLGGGVNSFTKGCQGDPSGDSLNPNGEVARYMADGNNILAGNGGGGGGRARGPPGKPGGAGSPGIIVIVIPSNSTIIPTFNSRGYTKFSLDNKDLMGKISNVSNNYFVEDNLNYPGNDIEFNKAMSQTNCASKCDNDVNCIGFAVNPDGCYTKKALKNQVYAENLKTYIKSNTKSESSNSNLRQLNFSCPTVDGKTCYDDVSKLDKPPMKDQIINQINCNTTFDPNNIPGTLKFNNNPNYINSETCENIFTKYNLFPTNNPLVVVGNDVKSNIYNTINNTVSLKNLKNQYQNSFKDVNLDTDISKNINKAFLQTPLKIACCNRNRNVNTETLTPSIKVSLSPNVYKESKDLANLNYENKNFEIPANTCPTNLIPNSDDCNVFYASYCQNFYDYLKSKGLSDAEILNEIPYCACYFPKTPAQQYYPPATPSICYKDGCIQNSISYLDPSSQGQQCSLTICQNIFNAAVGSSTDSSIGITPTLENNCGQYGSASSNKNSSNGSISGSINNTLGNKNAASSTSTSSNTSDNSNLASNINNSGSNSNTPTSSDSLDTPNSSENSNNTIYIIVAVVVILLLISSVYLFLNK